MKLDQFTVNAFSGRQFGGNTYIVQDRSTGTTFQNGTDVVVELTGLVNVQGSTYAETATTLSFTLGS